MRAHTYTHDFPQPNIQSIHAVLSWACHHLPSSLPSEPPTPHHHISDGSWDWLGSAGRFSHGISHVLATICWLELWSSECPCGWKSYLSWPAVDELTARSSAGAVGWNSFGCSKQETQVLRRSSLRVPKHPGGTSHAWASGVPEATPPCSVGQASQ